ncbi:MAG: GIY-YIG nuclease family protein [Opitutae bacterium]|nr:GIY-YIG nuclease family protein [Opitutae bacterium]
MKGPRPFNIRIFVAEGMPDGLRLVEKSNWVGLGIICPRGRYAAVKKRAEFSGSGIYILVGQEGEDGRPTLYIGEAEKVRNRLDSHYAKKDFWQQAIIFTTKGDPLNKAEVQYLEARLVERASKLKRCQLDNANNPQRPGLSEADEAEVAGYLDEMLSLLPVIGVDAFESVSETTSDKQRFFLNGSEWEATGYPTNNGFAVEAGSIARGRHVPSMPEHVPGDFKKREQLIADGILIYENERYRFTVEYEFTSPSLAAAVCKGRSANGRVDWKDANGISLKEHQEREAEV